MSEITKLYENAVIKPLSTCNNCNRLDEYWNNGTYCSTCKDDKDNDECSIADYIYPPFTAEKQIELIKWLSDTDYYIHNIYKTIDTKEYCIENYYYDIQTDKFEEALARLINKLWQDLTEEEKQQIKEILE